MKPFEFRIGPCEMGKKMAEGNGWDWYRFVCGATVKSYIRILSSMSSRLNDDEARAQFLESLKGNERYVALVVQCLGARSNDDKKEAE